MWAAPEQFPLIFNYNAIEYQLESALACLRAVAYSIKIALTIKSILLWAAFEQFPLSFN